MKSLGVIVKVMTDKSLPLVKETIAGLIQSSIIESSHGEARDVVLPVEQKRARRASVSRFAESRDQCLDGRAWWSQRKRQRQVKFTDGYLIFKRPSIRLKRQTGPELTWPLGRYLAFAKSYSQLAFLLVSTKIIYMSSYMTYLPAFLVLTKKRTGSGEEIIAFVGEH